jgi:ankyrin repeat protein
MNGDPFDAIKRRDLDGLTDLLVRYVDPNAASKEEPHWTPLHEAMEQMGEGGSAEAVLLLLRYGADVEGRGSVSGSPLLFALFRGHRDAAFMLLAAGADANRSDDEGDSALGWCVQKRDYDMVATLLRCGARGTIDGPGGGAGMTALGRAAYLLDVRLVRMLLRAGANPSAADGDRFTPIERMRLRPRDEPGWTEIEQLLTENREL